MKASKATLSKVEPQTVDSRFNMSSKLSQFASTPSDDEEEDELDGNTSGSDEDADEDTFSGADDEGDLIEEGDIADDSEDAGDEDDEASADEHDEAQNEEDADEERADDHDAESSEDEDLAALALPAKSTAPAKSRDATPSASAAAAATATDEDTAEMARKAAKKAARAALAAATASGDAAAIEVALKDAKAHSKFLTREAQKGVVHITHIPPLMRPLKVRRLLAAFGELGRVYLEPEDAAVTARRRKSKRGSKLFTQGWVEFADKRKAKKCALMLNGQLIAGSARSRFANDMWSIRYLSGFKWEDLTEAQQQQRAQHEASMRVEMQDAKRESTRYMEFVDFAKRQAKREAAGITSVPSSGAGRGTKRGAATSPADAQTEGGEANRASKFKGFKQRSFVDKAADMA
jgi:ESF2/ABP1 family protein